MNILEKIDVSDKDRLYWEQLIGQECLVEVLRSRESFECMKDEFESEARHSAEQFYSFLIHRGTAQRKKEGVQEGLFEAFFDYWRDYAVQSLMKVEMAILSPDLTEKIAGQMIEKITWTGMRCLIDEMGRLKTEGRLHGQDSAEEYADYLETYLEDPRYIEKILEKYPVLTELLAWKIEEYVRYMAEVQEHLQRDKEEIVHELCESKDFSSVMDIRMNLSDEHGAGRTVLCLALDNGYEIYYKPHDLNGAACYDSIYQWLLYQLNMKSVKLRRLNRGDYGWEQAAPSRPCASLLGVQRFYERLGIQLCLTYILGISDLHMENVIACGEYPLLVDLEIFPDAYISQLEKSGKIEDIMKDTVRHTGLLPGAGWGMNIGGISENNLQETPFKMPVIQNRGTSDMCIAYDNVVIKSSDNIPVFDTRKVDYKDYADVVIKGFEKAYNCILKNKQVFIELVQNSIPVKTRYILRNTQEYLMYMNSSNFPAFMQASDRRFLLLHRMNKGLHCQETYRQAILQYEVESIYRLSFPIYYAEGRNLILGNGRLLENYFSSDIKQQMVQRLDRISVQDMAIQRKVIVAALWDSLKEKMQKTNIPERDKELCHMITPESIADQLTEEMIVANGSIGWLTLGYSQQGKALLQAADMYFYGGCAGITAFFAALSYQSPNKKYKAVFHQLINHLFYYTDGLMENQLSVKQGLWGLFTGEMSIVLAYWMIYRITQEKLYLTYAEKHGNVVLCHLNEIAGCDLLDGKAGAVIGFLYLYEETHRRKYLSAAEYLAECLIKEAVPQMSGVGWPHITEAVPLAGMAHGNSGVAMAFGRLWKYTEKEEYLKIIQQAMDYEDTLYDMQASNWMDIRSADRRDMVAWCHGAGGILMARDSIQRDTGSWFGKVKREQIVQKIKSAVCEDSCLCHGTIGLGLILQIVNQAGGIEKEDSLSEVELSVRDKMQPGFMNGMAGIGFGILCKKNHSIIERLFKMMDN